MEAFMDDEEEGVAVVAPAEVEAPPEVVEAPAPAEAEPSPPAAPAQGEPVVQAMAMPPVPLLALGVAGVAVFLFIGRKLFRRGKKKLDSYGAFIEYIHLEPAADTVPPAAPLSLAGLRFAWKDIFDIEGRVTGFGNPAWAKTHEPATSTAPAVAALLAAGATGVGKTVMCELAFNLTGENIHYGTPKNAAKPGLLPGGSSSGSAVAVAAGLVDFALGTDTGGSVRVPAAHNGVFGFRATHGAVSLAKVVPMAPSFDTAGWFARDPEILRRVGAVLLGHPLRRVLSAPSRVILVEDALEACDPEGVAAAGSLLVAAGSAFPHTEASRVLLGKWLVEHCPTLGKFAAKGDGGLQANHSAFRVLQGHEFWRAHGAWLASEGPPLAPATHERIAWASAVPEEPAGEAEVAKREVAAVLDELTAGNGVLCLPTVPSAPPPLRADAETLNDWRSRCFSVLCVAGMGGLPQVHIPVGRDDAGVPWGVSLIAARGNDALLLDMAVALSEGAATAYLSRTRAAPPANATSGTARAAASAAKAAAGGKGAAAGGAANGAGPKQSAADVLKDKGNAAFKAGKFEEAAKHYSAALKKADTAVLRSNRAMAYLKLGEFKGAEEDCTVALTYDKKNVKALLRRGTARAFQGNYEEALSDFEMVLVLEPQNKDAQSEIQRMRRLAGA